jgi:transcriptional regulator with XRE-family HTH domain
VEATEARTGIGRQISNARRERNLTRQDLATMLGVSSAQMEKYETGKDPLPAGRLYQLCIVLDLTVTELFKQPDEGAPL